MEDRLYEMWLCHSHEQAPSPYQYKEFVCVTDFKNIEPILDHYSKLWQKIVEPRFTDYRLIEDNPRRHGPNKLTESSIVENWESFALEPLLICLETGAYYWYSYEHVKLIPA